MYSGGDRYSQLPTPQGICIRGRFLDRNHRRDHMFIPHAPRGCKRIASQLHRRIYDEAKIEHKWHIERVVQTTVDKRRDVGTSGVIPRKGKTDEVNKSRPNNVGIAS
jgi:Holliday junction resolvasome RuvABC ATP-dependent DNA helicase subunit